MDSGSLPPIPPPSQLLPSYIPLKKFTTWPIDPNAPGYSTRLQGFGDTQFAWEGRNLYYRQLGRLHNAIDIFVDSGATVVSVGDGFVVCVSCGISDPVEGYTDPGIGIYHDLCGCVMYYVHLSSFSVEQGDEVQAGQQIGSSGIGFGHEHLHLEIRPHQGAAEFYNPLYFFDPALLIDLSYQDYHNPYLNPEWRIIGYTSKGQDGNFYSYWDGTLPSIDLLPQ
ncbi:MAG: M23 family metallopeptidase [Anaerolineales bacterium]|nr:M23 family metallopeptidase [Anaerolineales bacterium]